MAQPFSYLGDPCPAVGRIWVDNETIKLDKLISINQKYIKKWRYYFGQMSRGYSLFSFCCYTRDILSTRRLKQA